MRSSSGLRESCCISEFGYDCDYVAYRVDNRVMDKRDNNRLYCYGPLSTMTLFRVSQQIYEEAHDIFFGENKFFLRIYCPEFLGGLFPLGSKAGSTIRYLHVRLESWEETWGLEVDRDSALIEAWRAFCVTSSPFIKPWRLHFTFACVTANVETALHLADILRLLPPLAHCALSFGDRLSRSDQSIVRDLGHELANAEEETTPHSPFPFSDLPRELRLHVLSFTDLATAVRTMHMQSDDRQRRQRWRRLKHISNETHEEEKQEVEEEEKEELRFTSGILDTLSSRHRHCCALCCATLHDCCCPAMFRATFSTTCCCTGSLAAATDLLLVSRQMHADAAEVLYGEQNRFCFAGEPSRSLRFLLQRHHLSAPSFAFLSAPPTHTWFILRDLVLELGWSEHAAWTGNRTKFLGEWAALLDFFVVVPAARSTIVPLNLTIRGDLEIYNEAEGEFTIDMTLDRDVYEAIAPFYRDVLWACAQRLTADGESDAASSRRRRCRVVKHFEVQLRDAAFSGLEEEAKRLVFNKTKEVR